MKEFIKKIIKRLVTSKSLVFVRKIIFLPIYYGILCKKGVIVYYNDPKRSKIFDLIEKIKSENEMLLENNEAYQIFMAVKRTAKVRGDIAEVGTYKGSSAKLICEARSKKLCIYSTPMTDFRIYVNLTMRRDFIKGNLWLRLIM